jgi:hypothetical protein
LVDLLDMPHDGEPASYNEETAVDHHLRQIADCLDEAFRLQSRVMDLTEQVYEAGG